MPESPAVPRWPRRLIIAAVALALLLGGAYWALVRVFPPQRLAVLLSQQVSERTGRDFRINGELSYRLLPRLAMVAGDLVLGNAPWGSRKDMLRIERAALDLELWPLLQGRVNIVSVSLDGVDLLLETDPKGIGNWTLPGLAGDGAAAAADRPAAFSLEVDRVHLGDVRLAYRDGAGGDRHALELQRLDLRRNAHGSEVQAEWELQKQRWQAKGQLARIDALPDDRADWPFDLNFSSEGVRIAAKGRLLPGKAPREAAMDIDARIDKPVALAPWVDSPASVPLPLQAKAALRVSGEALRAEALQLSLAQQSLGGQATLRRGQPWRLEANLGAKSFDVARLLPSAAGAAAPAPGARRPIFGNGKLPFDALPRGGVAKVDLRFDRLLLPDAPPLSAVQASLNLQPGSLKVEPLAFAVAGGQVRGSAVLNNSAGAAPKLNLQIDATELSAETLARAAGAGSYVTGGRMLLKSTLAMAGDTPHALAAGADGEVLLSIRDMNLGAGSAPIGPNLLPQLLGAITLKRDVAKSTAVECAVVRLPLKGGVAQVDRSIAIETRDLSISAVGHVDLRDETLELAFRPTPKGALGVNPAQLASLVMARGPILEPKLTLDAQGVAGMALSIGAAVASGGLSVLGQSLLKQANDLHPCQFAATAVAAKPAADRAQPPPASKPESLPGLLRRIFK